MPDVEGTATANVSINGNELSPLQYEDLFEVRVSKSTGAAAAATVKFRNAADIAPGIKVGDSLEVSVNDRSATTKPVFAGSIMSIGIEIAAGRSDLHVVAYDASLGLGNQVVYESHMNKSPADVIKAMASAAGLTSDIDAVLSTSQEHIQQFSTPHEFLSRLAHVYGCEWFVDNAKKLTVKQRVKKTSVELSPSKGLRTFSVRITAADEAKDVEVRGWDPATQAAVSGVATPSGTTALNTPAALSAARQAVSAKRAIAWPVATGSEKDAKTVADGLNARMEAAMVSGRGEVDVDARITPGVVLAISEVVPDWDGEYYVTEVDHIIGKNQPFVSRFKIGGTSPTTLVDLFGPRTGNRASSVTRMGSGVTIGVVTNIDDPDKLGRVKVKLPYISDDNETDWARVMQLGAGEERGLNLTPEVEDEVLVAFEHGELQRPFIIGGLHSVKHKPSTVTVYDDKVKERSLTTREGHHITLSDGPDAADQSILITLRGGDKTKASLYMNEEKIELIADGIPIEVKTTDANIVLTEKGDITLKGKKITLEASDSVTIKAKKFEAKTDMATDITAGSQLTLKGSTGGTLDGGAKVDIKGGMVNLN
ncbi:MAG: hypothetical protein ACJAXA_000917 [Candidatus Aldehydirespiratoraceae bacterium]|jgi:uncharacterized protein involved in type VI secretion and phage assembly